MDTLNNPSVHLITFVGGDCKILESQERFVLQAKNLKIFDNICVYGPSNLDESFYKKFWNITSFYDSPGFGYYAWKPYIINECLQTLHENDILVYLDVGCELNYLGKQRLQKYLDFTSKNNFLVFPIDLPHRLYCDASDELAIPSGHFFRNQIQAGIIFIKVDEYTKKIMSDWLNLCSKNGGDLLVGKPKFNFENLTQHKVTHRHDQAILTKIFLDNNILIYPEDEVYFDDWRQARRFPILALRNKTKFSKLNFYLGLGVFRFIPTNLLKNLYDITFLVYCHFRYDGLNQITIKIIKLLIKKIV